MAVWRGYLDELARIDRSALAPTDRMNYDIFRLQLEEFIAQIEFGGYQMPFNSDSGFHTALARLPRNMPMNELAAPLKPT